MQLLLRFMLGGLGASAICIGAMFIFLSPHQTATTFSNLFSFLGSNPDSMSAFNELNVDSEFRFYAVFWLVFGILVLRCAWRFATYSQQTPYLAAVFATAGLARLLGAIQMGWPDPLFVVLMYMELLLPIAMIGIWYGWARAKTP